MILITTHIDAERLAGSKSVSLVCSSFGFGDMAAFMKNGKMEQSLVMMSFLPYLLYCQNISTTLIST